MQVACRTVVTGASPRTQRADHYAFNRISKFLLSTVSPTWALISDTTPPASDPPRTKNPGGSGTRKPNLPPVACPPGQANLVRTLGHRSGAASDYGNGKAR